MSGRLAFPKELGATSVVGLSRPRRGMVSEELLSRSEVLAGENGVVRAGEGLLGGQALDFCGASVPVTFMGDGRRRK